MAPFILLLLAVPALAQPADCAAIAVGPPMDVEIYVGLPTHTPTPPPVTGGLGLTHLPSLGTRCPAPPPPSGDVLRGTPTPQDLLGGTATTDILTGQPAGEVLVGPLPPRP